MKTPLKIFNWIFSVFCMLCLLAYGFNAGAIMMFLLGIASLPVKPIREMWENLPKHKVLRPVIIGFLFFTFMGMMPPVENENPEQIAGISTEAIAETQETETQQIEPEKTETQELLAEETEEVLETETQEVESKAAETEESITVQATKPSTEVRVSVSDIPAYSGSPYVAINNNVPEFLETDLSTTSYEFYSDMDRLGRCGVAYACVGTDLMPTTERGSIGSVKPTGWHTVKYDVVDGKYLYNRCHLIGYQLSGENANTKNLITGTRYLNMDGMLPFENMVADYVEETNNHVMYRVTPVFEGDNLVASGVQIEAESVEDSGAGILFNVYCYNVQPDVEINYATGDSNLAAGVAESGSSNNSSKTSSSKSNTSGERTSGSSTVSSASSGSSNTGNSTSDSSGSSAAVSNDTNTGSGSSGVMVWKTATGSKYHSINNCGNTNPAKATQITEEEAIREGLGKCSKCW